MSTRATIVIKSTPSDAPGDLCLYRHSDGYPSQVLADIAKAEAAGKAHRVSWKAHRTGYAASLIVMSDPEYLGYQPTHGIEGHADAEYVYVVDPAPAAWSVAAYRTTAEFWDDPGLHNCEPIGPEPAVA